MSEVGAKHFPIIRKNLVDLQHFSKIDLTIKNSIIFTFKYLSVKQNYIRNIILAFIWLKILWKHFLKFSCHAFEKWVLKNVRSILLRNCLSHYLISKPQYISKKPIGTEKQYVNDFAHLKWRKVTKIDDLATSHFFLIFSREKCFAPLSRAATKCTLDIDAIISSSFRENFVNCVDLRCFVLPLFALQQ